MESEIVLSGPYGQRQLGSLHLLLHCGMEVLVPGPVLCSRGDWVWGFFGDFSAR